MTDKPTRRELLRPLHLLAIALGAALFAGVVAFVTSGGIQSSAEQAPQIWMLALVIAGGVFIVVLIGLAMLLLVIDPADVQKTVDRPVLLPPEDDDQPGDAADGGGDAPRA